MRLKAEMLDRLKSLPLTIFLTILIWMYAEAQFTSQHDDVRINVRILAPTGDKALRVYDLSGKSYSSLVNLRVNLQGPKSQIERIYQESLASSPDEDFAGLAFVPTQQEMDRAAATGAITVHTVSMLNNFDYFRGRSVHVTSASPDTLRLEIDRVVHLSKTPEFRPGMTVEDVALAPETVTVHIPAATLEAIGGESKLTVVAEPQRDLSTLPADSKQDGIPVRFNVEYPGVRDDRIRVTPATGTVSLRVPRRQQLALVVPTVPVWISGPPSMLARYDIDLQPRTVSVTVAGSAGPIDALRKRIDSRSAGVVAYLDITTDDQPSDTLSRRRLRYVLPDGLSLLSAPPEVSYRLVEKPPAAPASPAPNGAPQSAPATDHP